MTHAGAGVHAVILAAGRASRMEGPNKLLARFDGVPLVRRVALRAIESRAAGTLVVTGHDHESVGAALAGLRLHILHNPGFASGIAGSLARGIAALPEDAAGALVMLADMPAIETGHLDQLIDAFVQAEVRSVVRTLGNGQPANPVVLPRDLFQEVMALQGDEGARRLIRSGRLPVVDLELGPAACLDIDTPEALAAAGGELPELDTGRPQWR